MDEDLSRSRAAGFAAAHLVKPVTIGMLEDTIASLSPFPDQQSSAPSKP